MRLRAFAATLAPVLIAVGDAEAQFDEVVPGTRLRVQAPGVVAERYVGTVLERRADTLFVSNGPGSRVAVAARTITSLEIDRGRSRGAGAKVGAVWGAGVGTLAGLLSMSARNGSYDGADAADSISAPAWVTMNAIAYGLIGAGIGAIVGRRRWERFDVPTRVSVLPSRRGTPPALSWTP
jgi:hypothetical protein